MESVVDYAITEVETLERISEFKIGKRIESDYQPIEIEINEKSELRETEEELELEIEDWSEGGIRKFKERLKEVSFERERVQEGLREPAEKIKEAVEQRKWNKECRESKTELNRKLREYKAGKIDRKEFTIEKKRYKRICKKARKNNRRRR